MMRAMVLFAAFPAVLGARDTTQTPADTSRRS